MVAGSPREGKMHCGGYDEDHEEIKNFHVGLDLLVRIRSLFVPVFRGVVSRQ